MMKRVVILGSTGSIGVNALGVTEQLGKECRVVALSAHSNTEKLLEQIKIYKPEAVSVWEESAAKEIRAKGIKVRGKSLIVLSGIERFNDRTGPMAIG